MGLPVTQKIFKIYISAAVDLPTSFSRFHLQFGLINVDLEADDRSQQTKILKFRFSKKHTKTKLQFLFCFYGLIYANKDLLKGPGKEKNMLQNYRKYSVFNGSNFNSYFYLLIEISSKYFLNTSLDFLLEPA